jgi:hypothetical protein
METTIELNSGESLRAAESLREFSAGIVITFWRFKATA